MSKRPPANTHFSQFLETRIREGRGCDDPHPCYDLLKQAEEGEGLNQRTSKPVTVLSPSQNLGHGASPRLSSRMPRTYFCLAQWLAHRWWALRGRALHAYTKNPARSWSERILRAPDHSHLRCVSRRGAETLVQRSTEILGRGHEEGVRLPHRHSTTQYYSRE